MKDMTAENHFNSDESDNEDNHAKLLASVSRLDKSQRVKAPTRRELNTEVSEFHLTKDIYNKNSSVHVSDLVNVLGHKSNHAVIGKKLKDVTKGNKSLPRPLEKPAAEKIKRILGYANIKNQVNKWAGLVHRNRLKDHIEFPMSSNDINIQDSSKFLSKFKYQTPLEQQINEVLSGGAEQIPSEKDSDEEFPLSLEEIILKRQEMARLRARQSYREIKFKQQKKIKSKKFHRIQRKQKIKDQIKEFESLQKTDPEAALKKLEELEKSRAKERASLRHKNTGHWAKNQMIRAKYNIESRKVLSEQLSISKELTQKTKNNDDSSDDEVDGNVKMAVTNDNPWSVNGKSEVDEFVSGYRKFWEEKMKHNGKDNLGNAPVDDSSTSTTNKQSEVEIVADVANVLDKNADKLEKNPKTVKTPKKRKISENTPKKSDKKLFALVTSPSGVWEVEPIEQEPQSNQEGKKMKKERKIKRRRMKTNSDDDNFDIEELFTAAEDNMMKKLKKYLQTPDNAEQRRQNVSKLDVDELDLVNDLRTNVRHVRPDEDVCLSETVSSNTVDETPKPDSMVKQVESVDNNSIKTLKTEIDPNKFIKITPKLLNSQLPDNVTCGDEGLDDDNLQHATIMEAFVDDDVVNEFNEMKANDEKTTEMKEIDLALPGWGDWAGSGINPSKRKKQFRVKPQQLPARKDRGMRDTIINEDENLVVKEHMVKEVPFPFTSVTAFESSIRAPIGREWIPESAHKKLTLPAVVSKLGTVIEPITEDQLLSHTVNKQKSLFKGKSKK